ncbi:MAG TPA: type IV toxin-antitoxin system AbiEi family antitoxin [Gemmatimonadota bacterium]|nr:type IV toxin-antitoxin system AbiEi family antitoxin [Gemmatimonadota bacterium]
MKELLLRWTQDYQATETNSVSTYVAPRGLEAFTAALKDYEGQWALTGSLAVPPSVSRAPSRLATCYVDDSNRAAKRTDIRPTESGTNVLLLEPFDSVVWQRGRTEQGLNYVALSQCAADLLTGTGRQPAEAEELMKWMADNEDVWRA